MMNYFNRLLKIILIICVNFRRNLIRNLCMLFFAGLSAFMMNLAFSYWVSWQYTSNLIRNTGLYENYLFIDRLSIQGDRFEEKKQYLDDHIGLLLEEHVIEGQYTVRKTSSSNVSVKESSASICSYSHGLLLDISYPVQRGRWFLENDMGQTDYIPLVVGHDLAASYPVGTRIKDFLPGQEAVVIGVLKKNCYVLELDYGGNGISAKDLFAPGNNAIIFPENENELFRDDFSGVLMKMTLSGKEDREDIRMIQNRVFEEIGDISYLSSFAALADRADDDQAYLTIIQTIIFLMTMAVCLIGVGSTNLLYTVSCRKRYAIYYLNGMKWSEAYLITCVENFLKMVIPSICGYIAFVKFVHKVYQYDLYVRDSNLVVTFLFAVLIFFLTSILPLEDMKKNPPLVMIEER